MIELEPEMPDGTYKTSILQFIEPKPSVGRSDASIFFAHPSVEGLFNDRTAAQEALDLFIDELARLPRMTREFYGWMIDESEEPTGIGSSTRIVNADYVYAKCQNMPNFQGEIRLLKGRTFLDYDQDHSNVSGYFSVMFPGIGNSNFGEAFHYFCDATGLTASTLFSTMNFSPFGPLPTTNG